MLQKTIAPQARLVASLAYFVESYRVKSVKILGRQRIVDPLWNLYVNYVELVRRKEINPLKISQNHQIFLDFRKSINGKLTLEQEQHLIELLNYKLAKWFVPHVLNVTDHFSIKLMNKLIDTAISIKDPRYNFCFLNPAIRVFDLRVNLELNNRFAKANFHAKRGIIRAFPWVKSRRKTRIDNKGTLENYGVIYSWSGMKFEDTKKMKPSDFEQYCQSEKLMYDERLKLLLYEYFKTSRKEIKYSISWYLPKEIQVFPETLQNQAIDFLNGIK